MHRRRVLATGAAVALAGCVSYTDDTPSSEALIQDAIERRQHMTDLEAQRTMRVETTDDAFERVAEIAREPPAKQRIEVVESTDPDVPAGSVIVTNRTTTWEYNPATEVADRKYHPNKVDSDGTKRELEKLQSASRLGYEGTEAVDGRRAHVIETRPPVEDVDRSLDLVVGDTEFVIPLEASDDREALSVTRTVWIDDEYRYPIKERNAIIEDGETRYEVTVTYADLSIDEGLAEDTFTYLPPADATVVTDGPQPDGIFDSRSAAEENLPYELPAPDVADAYVLDRITVVERGDRYGGTTTTLWYNDPNVIARELYVAVRESQRFSSTSPDLEQIDLDGRTAYRRDEGVQTIFWNCADLSYEVSSLREDTPLFEIASSIDCR
ncbi:LolA family protein [Natrinema salaciae]|uniref:Outer membrane lipoprotein-sorting protein n=1 Tax=Natrinema salaciae TaxID=1186196 RepID=A0A1H9GLD3_9EURY|nr:outer membrane lipoprotein carrier protein LolA [Natrinema salaciae]SEQ50813.1 Outer membrane lipoprotein-sorting protein [Natrinema salaciae]